MRTNRELGLAVKHALATGTIALCGAGAAYAQQATTAQPTATPVTATQPSDAKTTSTKTTSAQATNANAPAAKTTTTQAPLLLAQATAAATVPAPAAANASETPTVQTVVVTGSLIRRANAETAEAITILKSDTLKDQGITTVESALNTLTTNVPTNQTDSAVGTFNGGGSYANLRGLGQGRTLILLDGQRLAPNAWSGDAVDLSGIPFSAIDSVQVLREGASSLYGSDAIAGVINFITKKNYQGLELETTLNRPSRNGGASGQANFTFGHGDLTNDGWNFMLTGNYSKQQELQADQRPFSEEGFDPARGVTSTNNPGSWPASVLDSDGNYWQPGYPACVGNNFLTTALGNCAYRYGAATDLLPQSGQYSGLAELTKTLPANNQVQLQYFYTYSTVTAFAGPMFYEFPMDPASPYFPTAASLAGAPCWQGYSCATATGPNLTGVQSANGANPGSASPVYAVWTDPNNERYTGNINREQRVMLTFSGSNLGWDYSAVGNWSRNDNSNSNISGIPNQFTPNVPGHPALAPGGVLSDLINPFGPQSAAGQALINASYTPGVYQDGYDRKWSFEFTGSHPLGDVLTANSPATVAFGGNFGGEHFQTATTPYNEIVQASTGLGNSEAIGSRTTQALFSELDVPVTSSFETDLSYRWDRYSDFGTTQNGKISLRYQPASFVTLRATGSTGFRAPTLFNLYDSNSLAASTSGTMGVGNPYCVSPATYKPPLWTSATCNTQGLALSGGNAHLLPETSQNFNFGVILSPIEDLGITIDYYRILLKNTISTVPASAIYANPTGLSQYIVTNSSGSLTPSIASGLDCIPYTSPTCGYVLGTDQNTGRITTDGFDLSVQYRQRTTVGTFHEDLEGTAVTQFRLQQYSGGPLINLVGWYNTVPPAYRWQHLLRVDWTSPQNMWGAGILNRYFSSYIDQYPDGAGNQRTVGSWSTFDIYGSYSPIQTLQLLFGIKNVLDHEPPYTNSAAPAGYGGNFAFGYNQYTVDPNLRTFYINIRYKVF